MITPVPPKTTAKTCQGCGGSGVLWSCVRCHRLRDRCSCGEAAKHLREDCGVCYGTGRAYRCRECSRSIDLCECEFRKV